MHLTQRGYEWSAEFVKPWMTPTIESEGFELMALKDDALVGPPAGPLVAVGSFSSFERGSANRRTGSMDGCSGGRRFPVPPLLIRFVLIGHRLGVFLSWTSSRGVVSASVAFKSTLNPRSTDSLCLPRCSPDLGVVVRHTRFDCVRPAIVFSGFSEGLPDF